MYFLLVTCLTPTAPTNGTINCSSGDDGVLSYEDTCTVTCNNGYHLLGNKMRTCQSNGTLSGSNATCISEWLLTYAKFIKCVGNYEMIFYTQMGLGKYVHNSYFQGPGL